ncbi:hypothetical protein [Thalassiella azotivora]
MRVRGRAAGVVTAVAVASLLAGCAAASDDEPEPVAGVTLQHVMAEEPPSWQTGLLEAGARLQYVDGAYRMTATGWPLVSPNQDRRAVDLDPVVVDAGLRLVSGTGLYGVACGVTEDSAYVFVVGSQPGGTPYYGVATLRDGVARVLQDSSTSPTAPPGPQAGPGTVTRVGGRCSAGDEPGTAVLQMAVDGREVLTVEADEGEPRGQVGLVALSRSEQPLVVDVLDVGIAGPG